MKVVVIFIIVAPALSLQQHHHHPSDSYSSELDESRLSREYDYDQPTAYHRSRKHRHKKHTSTEKLASAELDFHNEKYIRHERRSHRRPKGHRRYSIKNADNCECDCMKCEDLQQCCQTVCNNECEQPEQTNQVEQTGLSPGNLVFVPYPYPLVVPPPLPPISPLMPLPPPLPMVPAPAPDATHTSITSVTKSTTPCIVQDSELENRKKQSENEDKDSYVALLRSLRHRKDLPLSRDYLAGRRPVRRYLPEYGAISDHIIDRLISRVRNVKDIH